MLPAWNVQMLRDLETDLRTRAERRRAREATPGSSGPAFEVASRAPTSESCLEPRIEGPLARAG